MTGRRLVWLLHARVVAFRFLASALCSCPLALHRVGGGWLAGLRKAVGRILVGKALPMLDGCRPKALAIPLLALFAPHPFKECLKGRSGVRRHLWKTKTVLARVCAKL